MAIHNTAYLTLSIASLRGIAEAIHNQAKIRFNNGSFQAIQTYRLPRDSKESLAMTEIQPPRHCERSEAIYSLALINHNKP